MNNPLIGQIAGGAAKQSGMNILQIMSMLRGKDPNAVMQLLAQKNPQFAQFMKSCQGKTPKQVAQEYGVDIEQIRGILK